MFKEEDVEREKSSLEKRKRNGKKKIAEERSRNAAYLDCKREVK